jgi:hypothetical protein
MYDYNHEIQYLGGAGKDIPDISNVSTAIFEPGASTGGTLFAAGSKSSTIARYDNWDQTSTANRKATWVITVPKPSGWSTNSFTESGPYLFVDTAVPHNIYVYSTVDGSYIGMLLPTSSIGGNDGLGNDDCSQSVRSFIRKNGEVVVLREEDYQAKNVMYRWTPPTSPTWLEEPVPTNLTATPGPEGNELSWTDPGGLFYDIYRSTSSSGPFTVVQSKAQTNPVFDPGLKDGTSYYYKIQAWDQTGLAPLSGVFSGAPAAQGTTYEAENGTLASLDGGTKPKSTSCTLCSNTHYATLPAGGAITLQVNATGGAGIYPVKLFYSYTTETYYPSINIQVNGGTPFYTQSLPVTATASTPNFVIVDMPLNAGSNTIILSNPPVIGASMPNIDRIVVPAAHL